MNSGKPESYVRYQVAAWWPEGMGGITSFDHLHDAEAAALRMVNQGNYHDVYIWKQSRKVIAVLNESKPAKPTASVPNGKRKKIK